MIKQSLRLGILIITLSPLLAQTPQGQKPSFEVASIKVNTSGPGLVGFMPGDRFNATNVNLRMLLQYAYRPRGLSNSQIIGGPAWIDTDRFDIQGKPEGDGRAVPQAEMALMVQSLLEDRFQMKSHFEKREMPVYNLVVVKEGKLKLSDDQAPPAPPTGPPPGAAGRGFAPPPPPPVPGAGPGGPPRLGSMPRGAFQIMMSPQGAVLAASASPISNLVNFLSGQGFGPAAAGRLVIDKTNLKGLYDIELQFTPEGGQFIGGGGAPPPPGGTPFGPVVAGDPSTPSLFTALQEQLGLKLESERGPVEVLVIDSLQKPSEN
jgi:uncharacterized protein (TIGR03435 family)